MIWLVLGVALWIGAHLVPSVGRAGKARVIEAVGDNGYRIAISLLIVAALALIVFGWRSAAPATVYVPPNWAPGLTFALMIVAFVLFGAAKHATRIKQVVRHPQLTAVLVWAVAHLVSTGDTRALVLFGGLGSWALISIPLINARDGAWAKPAVPSARAELKGLAISLAIFVVALLLHPFYTGVSPIPR
ncbi:MAG: NnrU family protein [Pseudomonadota bacterium]